MSNAKRPFVDSSQAVDIVSEVYGLTVEVVKELDSYCDRNFHCRSVQGHPLPKQLANICSHEYVLKILNSKDSKDPKLIDASNEVIKYLKEKHFPVPDIVLTCQNTLKDYVDISSCENLSTKSPCIVRMFEYLAGEVLCNVSLTSELCYEVGHYVGLLDKLLEPFPLENRPTLFQSTVFSIWDFKNIASVKDILYVVTDHELRLICEDVISTFQQTVLFVQKKFKSGIIHSDMNTANIIVKRQEKSQDLSDSSKTESYKVSGIIDFGDLTIDLYLFELAIAVAYVMLEFKNCPFEAASWVIKGYQEAFSLPKFDIRFLKQAISARFVQTLVIGYHTWSKDPENEYILIHAKLVGPILKLLWSTPDDEAFGKLTSKIC